MTGHDEGDARNPVEVALLREVAAVAADPTEAGVKRLLALMDDVDVPAMVQIRASATLLDIGYGSVKEGEVGDEDDERPAEEPVR